MGNPREDGQMIMMKLKNVSDKFKILSKTTLLKGQKNSKKRPYFVREDVIDIQAEERRYYNDLLKENNARHEDDRIELKMNKGRIIANNTTVKPKVLAPTMTDILRMTTYERETVKATKLIKGSNHVEKNSEFYSFVMKASNTKQVLQGYQKMRIKHADATHIVCVYRFSKAKSPFGQGYCDDGEVGAGRAILKAIKNAEKENIAIFVIRHYGKVHLGKRRFEIYQAMAESAIRAHTKSIARPRQARLLRANSQESMASVTSSVSKVSVGSNYSEYGDAANGAEIEDWSDDQGNQVQVVQQVQQLIDGAKQRHQEELIT